MPAGPGAGDDALGVGVSLEAARVLAARADRNWTLMILVTDGEEAGLMGAAALVTDRDVTSRLQAYVNVESIGSAGDPTLFETGPGNGWLVVPWARLAPRPHGASFGLEIYRRLPNDTDFSILKRQGIPGLNFAIVGDSYAYHTTRDTPERLSPLTVRHTGEQVVALMTALDAVDVTRRTDTDRTFFDLGGRTAASYGPAAGAVIGVAALLLGIMAWLRVMRTAIRLEGVLRWLLTALWTLAGSAAVIASMVGATWALRLAREVYHPWYARPGRLFLLLLAVGITVGWSIARLGRWLPARAHGVRHPIIAWSVALPVWIALGASTIFLAPGAAYLWLLPLLSAGLLLSIIPLANAVAVRAVSALVLLVAAALWLRPTEALLHFMVAIFGRLPVVTPVFVYAAVLSAAGVMLVPPLVATITKTRPFVRPSLETSIGLFAIAITAGLAYVAPAYTHEEPLRRSARAVQEGDGPAIWDVGSVEPGVDLGEAAPPGWMPAATAPPATVPFRRLPHPFVFRSTGPSLGPAPITIASLTVAPVEAGTELVVTVMPRMPGLAVAFVLPEGLEPARSNLPGVVRLRPLDGDLSGADARRTRVPRQLRPHRRRPAARPAGRRHRARARRRLRLAAAGVAAGRAHGLDGRSVLDRGPLRAADCAGPAATLDYVTVTVFGVIASRGHTMTNPFVYGEIVPVTAFVDREVELDRLGRDLLRRAEGLPHLAAPLRQVVARPPGAEERGPERRPHRRGPGQQLQLVRRLPRGLRPGAGVGRNPAGPRPVVAERDAVGRPARGAHRARRGRTQPDLGVLSRGPDRSRRVPPRPPGLCAARPHRRSQAPPDGDRARRVPGHRGVQRRERRACAPRRRAAAAAGRLRLLRAPSRR